MLAGIGQAKGWRSAVTIQPGSSEVVEHLFIGFPAERRFTVMLARSPRSGLRPVDFVE